MEKGSATLYSVPEISPDDPVRQNRRGQETF